MSYKNSIKKVAGKNSGGIMVYALSTCIWCRKTKALLGELGIGYDYVDVDLLSGDDGDEAHREMWKFNASTSFPLIVINSGEKVITGFDEDEIRKLTA